MYVKFHKIGDREVVAICDEDLLGKEFSEGDFNLKVSYEFYGGDKKKESFVKDILLRANNINLVGKKTIKLALDLRVINKDNILKIKGIPHALIF